MKNKIFWAKTKESAIIPSKRAEDAGFDIYACFDEDCIVINPNETELIPTGLISAFDSSKVAILKERGSTGTKGMGQRAGIIDSGYRGEWMVPITNHNNVQLAIVKKDSYDEMVKNLEEGAIIYPYEKAICQAIFFDIPMMESEEITKEEILNIKSERGTGKLGSSGK